MNSSASRAERRLEGQSSLATTVLDSPTTTTTEDEDETSPIGWRAGQGQALTATTQRPAEPRGGRVLERPDPYMERVVASDALLQLLHEEPSVADTESRPVKCRRLDSEDARHGSDQTHRGASSAVLMAEALRANMMRRRAAWQAAAAEAERREFVIDFSPCALHGVVASECGDECLYRRACSLVDGAQSYYIGTTESPCWRWEGGWWRRDGAHMPGHGKRYESMVVIGVDVGWEAARQERLVIRRFLEGPDGRQCQNVAPDARGCPRRAQEVYLYIVRNLA